MGPSGKKWCRNSNGRFLFQRRLTVRDVLTLAKDFGASLQVYFVPFLVYVVTGHSGGRAVTFRDATGQMFVKHMFYHVSTASATGENMVQTANRIAATHRGTVPEVSFWTSQDIWDAIGCHDRLAQEARQVVELQCHSKLSHPSRAPKQDHLVRCCRRLLGHHSPLTYQSRPVAPVILAVVTLLSKATMIVPLEADFPVHVLLEIPSNMRDSEIFEATGATITPSGAVLGRHLPEFETVALLELKRAPDALLQTIFLLHSCFLIFLQGKCCIAPRKGSVRLAQHRPAQFLCSAQLFAKSA